MGTVTPALCRDCQKAWASGLGLGGIFDVRLSCCAARDVIHRYPMSSQKAERKACLEVLEMWHGQEFMDQVKAYIVEWYPKYVAWARRQAQARSVPC